MNLKGSYRALRNNSKAAMMAAIEIYNKPKISYRDECFSILLVNAWELLIKAILSKNQQRIFYPKNPDESYRTYSVTDALTKVKDFFPPDISFEPVCENIKALITYRDNAIHFYNQKGFSVIIYGLAQPCIINYRDVMERIFGNDIGAEMTISLLPLAFGARPDPIEFLNKAKANPPKNKAVADYLKQISLATQSIEARNQDIARFLTIFTVNFQSIKKTALADVVIGVDSGGGGSDPLIVERKIDPNISHPLRRMDILDAVGDSVNGAKFTAHTFTAIIWKYEIKTQPHLFWRPNTGGSPQYSRDLIPFIKGLTQNDITTAVSEYNQEIRKLSNRRGGRKKARK